MTIVTEKKVNMRRKLILFLLISALILGLESKKIKKSKPQRSKQAPKSVIKDREASSIVTYKILILMNFASKSHLNVFLPLARSLMARGHEVTFISPYSITDKDLRFKEKVTLPGADKFASYTNSMIFSNKYNPFTLLSHMENFINITCRGMFSHPRIQELIAEVSSKKSRLFDVVILNTYFSECSYPVGYFLANFSVSVSPGVIFSWTAASMGMAYNPALLPAPFQTRNNKIQFRNRLTNTIRHCYELALREIFYKRYCQRIINEFLTDVPSISELEDQIALVLTNHDPVFHVPRSFVPNVVAVPAMHCTIPKSLPKDLNDFVENSGNHGFILFSLGSIIQTPSLLNTTLDAFIKAFSALDQKVIWKLDNKMESIPENVKVMPWIPQQDLLGHPKIRLFITHGGLFGLQEALYHMVPILTMPVFGDQAYNSHRMEELGIGLQIDINNITSKEILNKINKILLNESYKENVKKYSSILKDVPLSSRDKAVFWLEYVVRHQGASHLQVFGKDLYFFQYFPLDIIAFLAVCTICVVLLVRSCTKKLNCILRRALLKQKND